MQYDVVRPSYGLLRQWMCSGSTNLALGDVLSLLEAEFANAEREYQHADVDTDQEEGTEERQEDASAEKTSDEEDDHDLSHGEL